MGCSSCAQRAKNRTRYEVVTDAGKVVYTSTSKPTAQSVSKRYPNSTVKEIKPANATAKAK